MSAGLAVILAGLSLVDSTSFGTLLIPIWLLLAPGRVRLGRVAAYLATVAGFYFLVGVALAAGADAALTALRDAAAAIPERPLRLAQLAAGAGLIALSYWLEARIRRGEGRDGRLRAWRARAVNEGGGSGTFGLVKLALVAAGIEVATMVPYLAAIGLLTAAELSVPAYGAALAVYCLIMVLPAALLTVARVAWHGRADRALTRVDDWLTRNNAKAVGWTVGGIGIGVTLNALINLTLAP